MPLVVISGQLRREMLRSIDKKKYSQVLVDAYTQEQLQSPGEFKGFLDRFRDVKNRILKDIGGASGLPSSATSATSASDWTQQDIGKWIKVFRDVTSSTRVFQADLYFGHALFGLCLRRLSRRFELALNFEAEAAEAAGDSAVDSNDLGMQSERFANFVEMLAKTNDRALDEVLSLGPNVLAAIRRQTDAIFGKGLRDELQQPIERAIKEIEENPDETPPIAKYTSLFARCCRERRASNVECESGGQRTDHDGRPDFWSLSAGCRRCSSESNFDRLESVRLKLMLQSRT